MMGDDRTRKERSNTPRERASIAYTVGAIDRHTKHITAVKRDLGRHQESAY